MEADCSDNLLCKSCLSFSTCSSCCRKVTSKPDSLNEKKGYMKNMKAALELHKCSTRFHMLPWYDSNISEIWQKRYVIWRVDFSLCSHHLHTRCTLVQSFSEKIGFYISHMCVQIAWAFFLHKQQHPYGLWWQKGHFVWHAEEASLNTTLTMMASHCDNVNRVAFLWML